MLNWRDQGPDGYKFQPTLLRYLEGPCLLFTSAAWRRQGSNSGAYDPSLSSIISVLPVSPSRGK